jgi:hypothetical protein
MKKLLILMVAIFLMMPVSFGDIEPIVEKKQF